MLSPSTRTQIIKYLPWLGVLTASIAIAVYMYFGSFTRYMSDDYCLLVDLNSDNVFTASWNKYLVSSNRFSNLFVLGVWELFPKSTAFVPALLTLMWGGGLFWLFTEINKLYNLRLNLPVLLLAAELLVVFTFYTTPNLFQSVYWRPGQVTYFTPLVFFSFLAAWLVRLVRYARTSLAFAFCFALLAFFIGGLSETVGAFHIAALSLAFAIVFLFDKSLHRKPALTLLAALLIGAFAALLTMLFSPANSLRISEDSPTPGLLMVLSRSLGYAWSFILNTLSVLPTPSLAIFGISGFVSYLLFTERATKPRPQFGLVVALIPIFAYALIFAIVAPSAYGQSYPVERVRFPAHFVLNTALVSFAVCIAYALARIKLPQFAQQLAIFLTALLMLYPLWMIRQPAQTYHERRLWAQRWDEREAYIYKLIEAGETDLVIPSMDGYEGTKELDLQANFWVNRCAADYYDVDSIATFSLHPDEIKDFFSE